MAWLRPEAKGNPQDRCGCQLGKESICNQKGYLDASCALKSCNRAVLFSQGFIPQNAPNPASSSGAQVPATASLSRPHLAMPHTPLRRGADHCPALSNSPDQKVPSLEPNSASWRLLLKVPALQPGTTQNQWVESPSQQAPDINHINCTSNNKSRHLLSAHCPPNIEIHRSSH